MKIVVILASRAQIGAVAALSLIPMKSFHVGFDRSTESKLLSRRQHAELVTIRIYHDHPAHLSLADFDPARPERDKTIDFCLLITAEGWGNMEVQPVLAGLRCQRRSSPGDL
nr:hypothetical protein [Ferrimicrobium sp.]